MTRYLLALDQGTTSSRSLVFDPQGRVVACAQQELRQHYPRPGWVEHDPADIWHTQLDTARQAMRQAGLTHRDIAAIGITNQRETTLLWDRRTGEPLHRAIVWQDRRTTALCEHLQAALGTEAIHARTGLRPDPYFSGTKLAWLLSQVPGARRRAEAGELAFGTVDTWLVWQLTGGRRHVTDVSNASRTLLWNLQREAWDDALLDALDIPRAVLPEVLPSSAPFGLTDEHLLGGPIAIGGVAGDQQSALLGQACLQPGMAKNTYGTGCFLLMHTGDRPTPSANGLLSTAAARHGATAAYALEGSVFVGGAVVQWLRDGLRAIAASHDVQALAASVPDSDGVVFVPAFTGLGAPYWQPEARGTLTGLTRGTTVAHIARAALDSIAYQSTAVLQAMNRDALAHGAAALQELRVDGGASVNDLLMQIQADLLGIPVVRPAVTETTALGAACLAGLQAGVFDSPEAWGRLWRAERRFEPQCSAAQAAERMAAWERAVKQATITA